MRPTALLLQLLLALALVLNGIGGAMAGVSAAGPGQPALPAQSDAHADARAATGPGGDCHGQPGDAPALAGGPMADTTDCHGDGDAPCGDGADCVRACLQASPAVPPLPMVALAGAGGDVALHPLACGHPAPLLRSPIRPPIA